MLSIRYAQSLFIYVLIISLTSCSPPPNHGDYHNNYEDYVACLKDESSSTRLSALILMMEDGINARQIIPEIIATLDDPEPEIREAAIRAIIRIRPDPDEVIPPLIELFNDDNSNVRGLAIVAIGGLCQEYQKVKAPLIGALSDKDASVRFHSAHAIGDIGVIDEDTKEALEEKLCDSDSNVRSESVMSLARNGCKSPDMVDNIIKLFSNESDKYARVSYITSLGYIGIDAEEAIPILIRVLYDSNESPSVTIGIPVTIARISSSNEVITALRDILTNNYSGLRYESIKAISILGEKGKETVDDLINLAMEMNIDTITDYNRSADSAIITIIALGDIGPDAMPAYPLIKDIAGYNEENNIFSDRIRTKVQASAVYAVSSIYPIARRPGMLHMINALNMNDYTRIKVFIISLLSKYGPEDVIIESLIGQLGSESTSLRVAAAIELGKIGRSANESLQKLEVLMYEDPEYQVYISVREAIGKIKITGE